MRPIMKKTRARARAAATTRMTEPTPTRRACRCLPHSRRRAFCTSRATLIRGGSAAGLPFAMGRSSTTSRWVYVFSQVLNFYCSTGSDFRSRCLHSLVHVLCQDDKERGFIPLESLHVTEVPEDKYTRTLCFEVASPTINRVFVLHADTHGELQDWMRAIAAASAALDVQKSRRRTIVANARTSTRVMVRPVTMLFVLLAVPS